MAPMSDIKSLGSNTHSLICKVYYTYIIKEIILPPDLLSPITGIEIERLASRLSRLGPATPVTEDVDC